MHHDFFACVRLLMLILLIFVFAHWCSTNATEVRLEQPEQKEPVSISQASNPTSNPLNAEASREPTPSNPLAETTPPKEAATIATEPPTVPRTEYTYTDEELEMLALVIYQEAGSDYCSDETRLMVGTVVMNRIADPRYPDTMYEVLTQEAQYGRFHWTGLVWPERASNPIEAHAVERAYAIAKRILQGERTLPEDVIFQSEYIQGEIIAHSDGMYFCR